MTTQQEWEKRFDKKFPRFGCDDDYCSPVIYPNNEPFGGEFDSIYEDDIEIRKEIKAFISTERTRLLDEVREMVEKQPHTKIWSDEEGWQTDELISRPILLQALNKLGEDK